MTRRSLTGAAVIPAAPLVLPEASPDQPAEVRDDVRGLRELARTALESLPPADLVVLLAAGPRGIYDRAAASLAPLGIQGIEVELPVTVRAIEHLSRLAQYPMFRGDPLEITHSVLALQLYAMRGPFPVLPVNVPAGADFEVLVSIGSSIVEATRDADVLASVVCAGDLSAGLHEESPAYAISGASEWNAAVVAAFEAGDLSRLRDLGPREAEWVRSLGWAPLAVLHGVCATTRLRPELVGYRRARGVGYVAARCLPVAEPAPTRYEAASLPRAHQAQDQDEYRTSTTREDFAPPYG